MLRVHRTVFVAVAASDGKGTGMDWPAALVASVTIATVGAVVAVAVWQILGIAKERSGDNVHRERKG